MAKQKARVITPFASAARTATANSESSFFPTENDELIIYADVTAVSGTGPTLDLTYEVSPDPISVDDATARWFTHTTFTQITATGKTIKLVTTPGMRGRIRAVIGGTTPSFTFRVDVEGKYRGNTI